MGETLSVSKEKLEMVSKDLLSAMDQLSFIMVAVEGAKVENNGFEQADISGLGTILKNLDCSLGETLELVTGDILKGTAKAA